MLREKLLECDSTTLKVRPSDYCLSIKAYADVVSGIPVELALKKLSYIYFMHDPRSSYAPLAEDARQVAVGKAIFEEAGYKPDKSLKRAMQEYLSNDTSTVILLKAARESVPKLKQWLEAIDITDEDYDPTKHLRLLEGLGKVVVGMRTLEDAAQAETESTDTRGGIRINKYSEGD